MLTASAPFLVLLIAFFLLVAPASPYNLPPSLISSSPKNLRLSSSQNPFPLLHPSRRAVLATTLSTLVLLPSPSLALDLPPPPPTSLPSLYSETRAVAVLVRKAVELLTSPPSTETDAVITEFVEKELFPPLKDWAFKWG